MATKEDVLEQIVEEYLVHKGYFVQHNIKFLPRKDHPEFISNQDSNHSDIDVIGYHPTIEDDRKVVVVSCKSWQSGFNPAAEIRAIFAPDPGAPPCMRQRRLPCTAGARHDPQARVLAPQRGLASIGPVLRA